jgi:leucyl/phenylalanyl-tRNA---protein transferase
VIPWLKPGDPFPALSRALTSPNGLLAAGGDLSPERLIQAYGLGIFPWFSEGEPILWWSPDPRMVLFPAQLKVARSLRKALKRDYEVRADTAFREVVLACARTRRPGQRGTWITQGIVDAYCRLHALGFAHSVETWVDGELAGGLYGVAVGRVFFGESMFTRVTDCSKIAMVHLVRQLERWEFELIDCQMATSHLASFGALEVPRSEFSARVANLVNYRLAEGIWTLDHDLHE